MVPGTDTKEAILAAGRLRVQSHGYNALSFRELAKDVGIKSASIHYHFPTKADLGAALARRYAEDLSGYLDGLLAVPRNRDAWGKFYTDVFRTPLQNDNRMCLCGIMAAEYQDLPPEVRVEVDRFTEVNVQWLIDMLSVQNPDAEASTVRERAMAIFAAIQGAQLVARGRGDAAVFDQIVAAYRQSGLLP